MGTPIFGNARLTPLGGGALWGYLGGSGARWRSATRPPGIVICTSRNEPLPPRFHLTRSGQYGPSEDGVGDKHTEYVLVEETETDLACRLIDQLLAGGPGEE